jgi:hypothetical protein
VILFHVFFPAMKLVLNSHPSGTSPASRMIPPGRWVRRLRAGAGSVVAGAILGGITHAFPPAPYYTLYGVVRDQVGQTVTLTVGSVALSHVVQSGDIVQGSGVATGANIIQVRCLPALASSPAWLAL